MVVLLMPEFATALQNSTAPQGLARMSGPEILGCAESPNCEFDSWELARALRKRSTAEKLIAMYPNRGDETQQIIVIALANDKSEPVMAFMRRAAFTGLLPGMTGMDNHYLALQYLADRCDLDALRELNRPENFGDSYPVGCMWWQDTLKDFGKCAFLPALKHLARSLNSACLSNTEAAQNSLKRLMPRSQCWKKAGLNGDFQAESTCYLRDMKSEVTLAPAR